MNVKIKKVHPEAKTPTYATPGSACFDLYPVFDDEEFITINPNGTKQIETGLKFEIEPGHVMLIFSRSGHAFKKNIRLSNCVGVIDSDYRGPVMVKLASDNIRLTKSISPDSAIAQAMIIPVQQCTFEVVEELSETERGEGGFGSTDKIDSTTL